LPTAKKAFTRSPIMSGDAKTSVHVLKLDEDQHVVYGWASLICENGTPIVDLQNDVIEPAELLKAATEFMLDARTAKAMHTGGQIGEVVHSFPMVADITKSFGFDTGGREGWIVGVKVHDPEVWKRVKSGEFKAFSIGAFAERVPV